MNTIPISDVSLTRDGDLITMRATLAGRPVSKRRTVDAMNRAEDVIRELRLGMEAKCRYLEVHGPEAEFNGLFMTLSHPHHVVTSIREEFLIPLA